MSAQKRVYVDPSFHKKLKKKAVDEDTTILELTRRLGKGSLDCLEEGINIKPKKVKRGIGFDFKF